MPADEVDRLLVARIRAGDATAWQECIARFVGRLLAFVDCRLRDGSPAHGKKGEARTNNNKGTIKPEWVLQPQQSSTRTNIINKHHST